MSCGNAADGNFSVGGGKPEHPESWPEWLRVDFIPMYETSANTFVPSDDVLLHTIISMQVIVGANNVPQGHLLSASRCSGSGLVAGSVAFGSTTTVPLKRRLRTAADI